MKPANVNPAAQPWAREVNQKLRGVKSPRVVQSTTAKNVSTNPAQGSVHEETIAPDSISADKLEATAIDGMTITGATIQTSASGDRTVMNDQGVTVYKGSAAYTHIGSDTTYGIQVWNPNTSSLVDVSSTIFGTQVFARTTSLTLSTNGSSETAFGDWTKEDFANTYTAPTSRAAVWFTFNAGDYGVVQNFKIRAVCLLTPGSTEYVAVDTGSGTDYGGVNPYPTTIVGVLTGLTPGASYTVRMQFQVSKWYGGTGTPWMGARNVVIQPI